MADDGLTGLAQIINRTEHERLTKAAHLCLATTQKQQWPPRSASTKSNTVAPHASVATPRGHLHYRNNAVAAPSDAAMANQVNERFAEDYPQTYKAAGGATPEDVQQKTLVGQMENLVADLDRRATLRAPTDRLSYLTSAQLDEEYAWIVKRLFDNRDPGRRLYEDKSRDFDQYYRDSADEVSMQFLNAYKERFGREPPQTLVEYAFPLMDASSSRKREVRAALDAAYQRLRAAALTREAPAEGVFLACPRGLRKA